MVRQRAKLRFDKTADSSSSNGSDSERTQSKRNLFQHWKSSFGLVCFSVAAAIAYQGYLETRVNTPYDEVKMVSTTGLDIPERYWGSYRPGAYFGLKTRDPNSLVTGLMWYFPDKVNTGGQNFRHWCEQSDNLVHYSWTKHDGVNFGEQAIVDPPFILKTSFVKRPGGEFGGDWTARVEVKNTHEEFASEEITFVWYTALDQETKGWIKPSAAANKFLTGVRGETSGLGKFVVKLYNTTGEIQHESFLSTVAPGLHKLKDTVLASLRLKHGAKQRIVLPGKLLPNNVQEPNLIATQVTVTAPFTLDIVYESKSSVDNKQQLVGKMYTKELTARKTEFDERFERTFKLKENGFNESAVNFAQAVFSNLMGGIGYFYGASKVQSVYTKEPVPYWKAPLYTAVPSRSFFPRGFLWDEGFHGLLIAKWDMDIALDVVNHWFDLMNVEGWIPREQILGVEAISKVPAEFVVQKNTNANPPTFFLTLQFILNTYGDQLKAEQLHNFERLLPRLQTWFNWFNTTQRGEVAGTYRWRGRDANSKTELNPKTLTSGLDDYPRASHPTDTERHVDLRCWIAMAASVIADISTLLNHDADKYIDTYDYLSNNILLDELHWSTVADRYADYGLHTDSVELKFPKRLKQNQLNDEQPGKVRVVLKDPEYRFIDTTFGYVTLFPLLTQILDADSPKLGLLLDQIKSSDLLWTNYGLRSLARNSPIYQQWNTEHDPPYWRGAIWIPMNYMTVKALNHYGSIDGPFRDRARAIGKELRHNLIENIMRQYYRSGYVFENYDDVTGEGKGARPFTGWTALVVLLMSDDN